MISILGFTRGTGWDELDAPQYYRCYLPLREVDRNASDIQAKIAGGEALSGATDDELGGRDIYTMARMYHENCDGFIAEIHRRGGILVLDNDDDLTETHKLVSGRGREFKGVLSKVDYVTVATPPLAEAFAQYTKRPPVVLRNHVDTTWMTSVASKAKRLVPGLTLGFSGSPTHWGDWRIPSVPFSRILHDYPVTGLLHGECPRYLGFAAQDTSLVKLGGVPFSIYPVLLKQFDILLCAVDNKDKFNDGKSAVKPLEAMAIGVVPIISRFAPYLALAKAGAPVVVVEEDTQDGWYEAMRGLIIDEPRRLGLSEEGPAWVAEHRDMVYTGWKHWADFYRSIV